MGHQTPFDMRRQETDLSLPKAVVKTDSGCGVKIFFHRRQDWAETAGSVTAGMGKRQGLPSGRPCLLCRSMSLSIFQAEPDRWRLSLERISPRL